MIQREGRISSEAAATGGGRQFAILWDFAQDRTVTGEVLACAELSRSSPAFWWWAAFST